MKTSDIIARIKSVPGITELNSMQERTLNSDARNLVLIAPTGSGKTIAFGSRVLKNIGQPGCGVNAVIIAPSRELVMQIASVMRQIAGGYKTVALYGGHSMTDEVNSLSPLPDIIVATPGRFLDHLQRKNITIERLPMLVLDEYDKSLQLGFEGEMKRIAAHLKRCGNITLTSATRLNELPSYLNISDAQLIDESVQNDDLGERVIIHVESFSRDKLDSLSALLSTFDTDTRSIVFVNHRESVERIALRLKRDGFAPILYHGALDQLQRQMAVDLFSNGTTPIMVATDLAARGLDIPAVENVIHYHLPVDAQAWTHRNGRTARQQASGTVFVITSEADTIADFISWERDYQPPMSDKNSKAPNVATLYISAGKKEKISRGDIVGFILANSNLEASQIGKITVHDHYAVVAVPRTEVKILTTTLNSVKLKGKKVKISVVKI